MYPCFAAWQQVSLVHKDRGKSIRKREEEEEEGLLEMEGGGMVEGGRGDQALRACHWATLVRGRPIMSFQCFTSAGPLFHDR